jgi:hypothetical protein
MSRSMLDLRAPRLELRSAGQSKHFKLVWRAIADAQKQVDWLG